jgi:hypothetical protein
VKTRINETDLALSDSGEPRGCAEHVVYKRRPWKRFCETVPRTRCGGNNFRYRMEMRRCGGRFLRD